MHSLSMVIEHLLCNIIWSNGKHKKIPDPSVYTLCKTDCLFVFSFLIYLLDIISGQADGVQPAFEQEVEEYVKILCLFLAGTGESQGKTWLPVRLGW